MINFEIGLRLSDAQLKSSLSGIRTEINKAFTIQNKDGSISKEIAAATYQAKALEKALAKATTDKGISYSQLNIELAKAGTTAGKLTATLAAGGSAFSSSLNAANNALALSNRQVISLNKVLQEASRVFKQSLKFTVAQTAIRAISTEVKESIKWIKNLNDAVNEIAVVTRKTGVEIENVTASAVKGSKELRIAAEEYAKGALIFYQQGLNDEEVTRRNEITIKAAKAANQSIDEMSKQLTAIWNTYGMVGDEQLRAASVGAKMAARTAVDFSDIAKAMQTAAAPAAQMGVEYNQLAAIIATVGDATQQSASIIGNAYKTIFSRFQQLVSDGTDGEVTLGEVSKKLQNLGVQLLNSDGSLKNLGTTINDVGQNWDNWTESQQLAIAQLVGGTRQYGQFLSLMQNFDKYQKNLSSAQTETGSTLEQQYTQALDSIESRAENAAEAWHRAFSNVFNSDQIKAFYKAVETVGNGVDSFLSALGGAPGIFFSIATLLSGKIVPSLMVAANAGKSLAMSLTPGLRESTIQKDFKEQASRIQNDPNMTDEQKAIATSKANFSKETALINERINNQLKTATGEYRNQLEMQKQQLETAQKTYQESLDEESSLKRKIELDQIRVNKLREALDVINETQAANLQELQNAQQNQSTAEAKKDAAKRDLDALLITGQGKFTGSADMQRKMQNQEEVLTNPNSNMTQDQLNATQRNYDELTARIVKVVAAEEKLKQAILEVKQAEEQVAAAQAKVNQDQDVQRAAQLAEKYNEIAQAVLKYDQARQLEGEGGAEYDALIEKIKEYIALAPEASKEVEELQKRLAQLESQAKGSSLNNVLEGVQNVNAATNADTLDVNGKPVTENADKLIDEHMRNTDAIRAQEEAQKKLAEQQRLTLQQGISAALQFGMVLQSTKMAVKNLIAVWSDDSDASVFEKIGKSIGIIGTLALTAIPSVISIINAVTMLGTTAEVTGMAAFKAGLMAQTGLGPLLPVVLAITAAVVGLVVVIGLIADAIKKADPHYQLEQAQKDATAFADALNDAKQEAEELKQAFDSYDEIQDKLKDCTIGTQEWKDALKEANDQVLELIRDYPELASAIESSMVNGQRVLSINKEGMEALQAQQDTLVTNLTAASVAANQRVRDAELAAQKSDIVKDVGYGSLTTTERYQGGSYEVGKTGKIIDNYIKEILSATPDQMEALAERIIEEQNLDQSIDTVKKTLESMIPSLKEYDAAIIAATEAKRIENEMIADSIIQNSARLSGYKDSNAMNAAGAIYGKVQEKAYKEALAAAQSRTWYNAGTDESIASFKAYAEGMKLKDWKVTNYKGNGKDASVEYEYYDDEGKKQTAEATAEMIAKFNAAAAAGEELEKTLIALAQQTDKLASSDDSGDQALSSFLGKGDLEGATQGQFNDIKADVSNSGGAEAYLKEKFGDNLSEIAEIAGYDSAEEFVAAFEESLKIDWNIIPEGLRKYEPLNLAQAKRMAEVYETAMKDGGEEAAKAYTDGLDYILKDVSQKDMKDVLDQLSYIDWSDWDAGKQIVAIMKELGYSIDTTTDEWGNFTEVMRDSFDAVPNIEAINKQIKGLNDLASDISLGDIISKEDYDNMKDFNDELTRYFTLLSDGSAAFIGDPLDFKQAVEESGKQALISAAKELQDSVDEAKAQYDAALKAAGDSEEALAALRQSQNRVINDEGTGESSNHYGLKEVTEQIAFLESMDYDTTKIEEFKKAITAENGEYHSTVEQLEEIGAAVDEMVPKWKELGEASEQYQQQIQGVANQIAVQAESFQQLEEDLSRLNLSAEEYTKAFGAGAMNLINSERWGDLDVGEVEKYAKYLQKAATKSELLSDDLADNEEAAEDVARATKKLNQGVDKLANGFKDWSSILKESDEGSEEYYEALENMKDAMSDILDIQEDFLSDDFLLDNMEDIKLAAEGDADAIDRLRQAALEDIILNLNLDDTELTNTELLDKVLSLQDELNAAFPNGIEVGTQLDMTGMENGELSFVDKLNNLIAEAGMSVEQVNAMLSGMGFTANFASEPQKVTIREPDQVITHHKIGNYDSETINGATYTTFDEITTTETIPGETHEGEVDAYSLETSEPGTTVTPKINSITKTGSGAMNNYSSSNRGGTTTPGGGTKSNKGGGGSSKDFKKKDKEEKDEQKYLKRYENLTNALEELNDSLKHTANAQNDAWGNAKLAQMDRYILKVQKIAKTQKALIQETKDYYKKDKAALLQTSVGSLAKFDDGEYGDLLNPEDLRRELQTQYEAALAAYNNAVEAYNTAASTADGADADVEAQKEAYDAMVKSLDKDIKALDQFLETRDLLRERMEEQLENIRDWMGKKMEKIQYEIDMRIRIPERDIKQLERFISRVEDIGIETGSTLAAISTKWDNVIKEMQATWGDNGDVKTGIYRALEILENIDPNNPEHQSYFEKTFGAEAWQEYLKDTSAVPEVVIDKLHELYNQLLDYQEQLYDIAQEAFDVLSRKIEMWFEKLDKIQDRLDTHLTRLEMLESILDASNIKGTQAGRDAQRQINEAKKKNAWTSAHVSDATYLGAKQVYDDLNAQYEEILAERNALGDMNADNMEEIKSYEFVLKNLKAERDKAYEDMTAAEQERNQKIGEAAQMMKEMLEQEFEMLTTEFELGLNGLFATLDGAIQMFDDMAEVRDWYLDPFERDYEFQSLLNKIDKEIEDTNDPEYLKKLLDMRAKVVERQNDGKEITQEELDIENKRFELLQAEAAFEEAQNAKNKNTMRLMRDASGNYSYVYSDDEKEKDDLKQKLLDAKHNLYEAEKAAERAMDKLYYQQLQKIEQLELRREQALAEGNMRVVAECDELIALAITTLDRIAADEGRFSEMLRQDFGDNAAELNKSISAMIADYDNLQDAEAAHKEALIEYEQQMTAATEQMQIDMERELQELGIDYKNLAQTVKTETDNINRENEEMKNEVTKMKNQGLKDLAEYTNAINSWARNFLEQMNAIIQKLKELMKAIEAAEAKANSANLNPNSSFDADKDYSAAILHGAATGGSDYDYTEDAALRDEKMKLDKYSWAAPTSLVTALADAIVKGALTEQQGLNTLAVYNYNAGKANLPTFDIKKLMIDGLDPANITYDRDMFNQVRRTKWIKEHGDDKGFTNAYTGGLFTEPNVTNIAEKGPELVLNTEDTQKILKAVQLVRGQIDAQFGAVDSRLFAKTGRVADEITPVVPKTETDAVGDQKVYIEANFPGVSVASEIEDALNSLVVQAAQYQSKYHR